MGNLPEITVKDIAQRLKQRKTNNEPPTLFLGSRTGWYYNHEKLYEWAKSFSNVATAFDTYTDSKKFQECYTVLKSKRFNSGSIEDLLKSWLVRPAKPGIADICMAEMIFGGYFDVVISTTIDPLLQAGLQYQQSLEETVAYKNDVLILNVHPLEHLLREERRVNKTIKIFGDLETSRNYHTAQHELNLDDTTNTELKAYLTRVFSKMTVMIGFDSVWDQPIMKAFSSSGRDIIYINEDELDEESEMAKAIMAREGRWLIGQEGSYTRLMATLHKELFLQEPLSFALARKLSEQLEIVHQNIAEIQRKSSDNVDRVEHLSHQLHTVQTEMRVMHENVVWLQDAVQQLLDAQHLEKRKDD